MFVTEGTVHLMTSTKPFVLMCTAIAKFVVVYYITCVQSQFFYLLKSSNW